MRESEPYFTTEERARPYWKGLEHFQINTSYDPNVLGLHITPWGSNEAYQSQINLMNDLCVFNIDWTRQCLHRMNGFQAGRYKIVLHNAGWEPKDGYDKNIYTPPVGGSIGFD